MGMAGWYPDPSGRYAQRWFDGVHWTEHVAQAGTVGVDPLPGQGPTAPPFAAPPAQVVHSTAPLVAPARPPTNGVAVAALVVGIIGVVVGLVPVFFFVSGPLGLIAIVLGAVGLTSAVKRSTGGRGLAVGGIVTGVVAMVLAVVGIVTVGFLIDTAVEVIEEATGPADPSTYEVTEDRCRTQAGGTVSFTGTITNTDDRTRNYIVNAEFATPAGERLDRGSTTVFDVDPGESVRWEVVGFPPGDPELVDCAVIGVDNFFS